MKILMTAIALVIASPAVAQTAPAPAPEQSQHQQHGQGQHPGHAQCRAMASKAGAAPTATATAGWTAARAWPHRANVQARRRRRRPTRKGMTAAEVRWARAAAPAAALDLRQWHALSSRLISQ